MCDPTTGACECLENFTGHDCDNCADGFYSFPTCEGKSINFHNHYINKMQSL